MYVVVQNIKLSVATHKLSSSFSEYGQTSTS